MGIKLVLADDAPFIRDVLRDIFAAQSDIEVIGEAEDGKQAVEIAHDLKPDVILMDIVMPHKSGIEAAQEILKSLPQIRIVACSTMDQETMIMRALEAGCCSYLVKPFKVQEVLTAVRSAAAISKGKDS
jgi:two-component system chemotaxis response regulator CheY